MQIFSRRSLEVTKTAAIAQALDNRARKCELVNQELLSSLGDHVETINTLLYLTKVASIIHHLRILSLNETAHRHVRSVLDEFENLTYFQLPLTERMRIFTYIQGIIPLNGRLSSFFEKASVNKQETSRELLGWAKEWLGFVYEDGLELQRMGLLFGPALAIHVHQTGNALSQEINLRCSIKAT